MSNWWKDPRLDDEGTYDYLAEKLPEDHVGWERNRYTSRCDSCGKESHLILRATHYFYCYDGWDSMDSTECWKCVVKRQVCTVIHRIKKEIDTIKHAWWFVQNSSAGNFKYWYGVAKKMER